MYWGAEGVFFSGPNSYLFRIAWIILGGPGNVFDTTYMDEMNGCRFPTPVFAFILDLILCWA